MEKNHYNPHRLRAVMATLFALLFGAQTVQAQTKEAYAYVSTADRETLYFYYDTNRATRNSTGNTFSMNAAGQVPDWYKHYDDPIYLREKVKKVVFDYSFRDYRPTSTCYWFASMQLLTTIEGFSNLYTQNVTDMSYMFRSCNRLTTLDFHNQSGSALNMTDNFVFNTEKVTTMKGMFSYCYDLTSLNLSGWDTGAVKDMSEMFKGCTHLEALTLGAFSTTSGSDKGWNTSKVTDMNLMFGGALHPSTQVTRPSQGRLSSWAAPAQPLLRTIVTMTGRGMPASTVAPPLRASSPQPTRLTFTSTAPR